MQQNPDETEDQVPQSKVTPFLAGRQSKGSFTRYKSTSPQRNIAFPCSSPYDIDWTTMFDQRMRSLGSPPSSTAALKTNGERTRPGMGTDSHADAL